MPPREPAHLLIADSITTLGDAARGRVVVCASHGGTYTAQCAMRAGVRALIVNDAGIGRERAGVAGLGLFDQHALAAAAIDCRSARIGDGEDGYRRGIVSTVNEAARACGVRPGMAAREASERFATLPYTGHRVVSSELAEARYAIGDYAAMPVAVLDSNSLVADSDRGAVVVTASHGGLLGGNPRSAMKADAFAAVFNDATIGIDNAGIGRLAPLDARGIAAVTVSAWSARIGDGRSTLEDGFVSACNERARGLGAEVGLSTRALLARFAEQWPRVVASSDGERA
jgi:hypothetical protein